MIVYSKFSKFLANFTRSVHMFNFTGNSFLFFTGFLFLKNDLIYSYTSKFISAFTKKIIWVVFGTYFNINSTNLIWWFGMKMTNLLNFTVPDFITSLNDFIVSGTGFNHLNLCDNFISYLISSWFGAKMIVLIYSKNAIL